MLMMAFIEQEMGYSKGKLLQDYTFKIFKEKLVLSVYSTVDINQNGKCIAFGPSSHQDADASAHGALWIKQAIDGVVNDIRRGALPTAWTAAVKGEVMSKYAYIVSTAGDAPEYRPARGLSDAADAIKNGICRVIDSMDRRRG